MTIFTGQSTCRNRDDEHVSGSRYRRRRWTSSDLVAQLETVQRVWSVRVEDLGQISQSKREVSGQLAVAVDAVL